MAKIQGYDLHAAKKMAEYFFEIGRESYLSISKVAINQNQDYIYKSIVGNVNTVFACEIILKILNYEEGVDLKELDNEHRLNELFQRLPEEKKNIIKNDTVDIINSIITNQEPYSENNFYEDLEAIKNAYVGCRYWYEIPAAGKKGKNAKQLFGYAFCKAMFKWIN